MLQFVLCPNQGNLNHPVSERTHFIMLKSVEFMIAFIALPPQNITFVFMHFQVLVLQVLLLGFVDTDCTLLRLMHADCRISPLYIRRLVPVPAPRQSGVWGPGEDRVLVLLGPRVAGDVLLLQSQAHSQWAAGEGGWLKSLSILSPRCWLCALTVGHRRDRSKADLV